MNTSTDQISTVLTDSVTSSDTDNVDLLIYDESGIQETSIANIDDTVCIKRIVKLMMKCQMKLIPYSDKTYDECMDHICLKLLEFTECNGILLSKIKYLENNERYLTHIINTNNILLPQYNVVQKEPYYYAVLDKKIHVFNKKITIGDLSCYSICVPLISHDDVIGQLCVTSDNVIDNNTIIYSNSISYVLTRFITSKNTQITNHNTEQLDMYKFLSTISHEIKTPLNSIIGITQILNTQQNLTQQIKEYIDILNKCSIQLLGHINDILDLGKIISGKINISYEPFDVIECINTSINIVKHKVLEKNISIIFNIETANNPKYVLGDSRRLNQVLINLISNSIKYTSKGFIKISVSFTKIERERDVLPELYPASWRIHFEVKDTGIGISKEEQTQLFNMFSRINRNIFDTADVKNGNGIGLTISKEIVRLMGGDIHVESDGHGNGSTFIFDIVVEENINIPYILRKYESVFRSIEVIAVDDKMENRMMLIDTFYRWGIKLTVFSSPEEIYLYLCNYKESISMNNVKMIIVDICMPNISGTELSKRIKELIPSMYVLGLSSIGDEFEGRELLDKYMSKPINETSLFKSVASHILTVKKDTKIHHTKSAINVKKIEASKLHVLIAEDDGSNSYTLTQILKQLGVKEENIIAVDDGKQAIKAVKKRKFDICFIDIIMPVMNGIDTSTYIKTNIKNSPILVGTSATIDYDSDVKGKIGFDSFISKPVNIDAVKAVFSKYYINCFA